MVLPRRKAALAQRAARRQSVVRRGGWLISVAWGAAAYRGYLAPANCGVLAGGIGALVGAILAMRTSPGQALAVFTVTGLLTAGVLARRVLLTALGAAGSLWVVPDTADRYLPGSVAAPLAVAVVGLILLAVALWLARARKTASEPRAGI